MTKWWEVEIDNENAWKLLVFEGEVSEFDWGDGGLLSKIGLGLIRSKTTRLAVSHGCDWVRGRWQVVMVKIREVIVDDGAER